MLMPWVAIVGPRIVGGPIHGDAGAEVERGRVVEDRVLAEDVDGQIAVAPACRSRDRRCSASVLASTTLKFTLSVSLLSEGVVKTIRLRLRRSSRQIVMLARMLVWLEHLAGIDRDAAAEAALRSRNRVWIPMVYWPGEAEC